MTNASRDALDRWIDAHAARLRADNLEPATPADATRVESVLDRIENARIVVLGELDHWIAEKTDFRLWWLRRLATRHRLVLAEELGHSDARRVAQFLANGDASWLDRVPTFGWDGDRRTDRDDRPTGILRASFERYPTARFKAAQSAFYHAVRGLGLRAFQGLDVNAVAGGGYADIRARLAQLDRGIADRIERALVRVPGESALDEATRLEALVAQFPGDAHLAGIGTDLRVMADTLRYEALAHPAADYDALRPAMAWREDMMKRAVDRVLDAMAPDEKLVLMAHALHLVKDDDRVGGAPGAGPGGHIVHSLGHYLARERAEPVFAVWFIFGGGRDCQPFTDLSCELRFPSDTLNARLLALDCPLVVPTAMAPDGFPKGTVGIGHLYSLVASVDLAAQADAIFFLPDVTPLPQV